jgi:truncated hemoglobin YjbI
MVNESELTPTDIRRLRREAERLIESGEMPTLEEVLSAVAKVREKYGPRMLAARMRADRDAAKRRAYIHELALAMKRVAEEEKADKAQLSLFAKGENRPLCISVRTVC